MNGDAWRIRYSERIGTEVERRLVKGATKVKLATPGRVEGAFPQVRWYDVTYLDAVKPRYEGAREGRA